jgi:hypothetical protein
MSTVLHEVPNSLGEPGKHTNALAVNLQDKGKLMHGLEDALQELRFSQRRLGRMPSTGMKEPSSYLTGNTLRLCYRAESVNAM